MAAVSTEDLLTQEMDDIFQDDDEVMDNGVLDSKYDNIDEDDETAGPVTIKSETKRNNKTYILSFCTFLIYLLIFVTL